MFFEYSTMRRQHFKKPTFQRLHISLCASKLCCSNNYIFFIYIHIYKKYVLIYIHKYIYFIRVFYIHIKYTYIGTSLI